MSAVAIVKYEIYLTNLIRVSSRDVYGNDVVVWNKIECESALADALKIMMIQIIKMSQST